MAIYNIPQRIHSTQNWSTAKSVWVLRLQHKHICHYRKGTQQPFLLLLALRLLPSCTHFARLLSLHAHSMQPNRNNIHFRRIYKLHTMNHGSAAIESAACCSLSRHAWAKGTMHASRKRKAHSAQETIVVFVKQTLLASARRTSNARSLSSVHGLRVHWLDVYSRAAGVHITMSRAKYSTNMVIICVSPYWLCIPIAYSRTLSLSLSRSLYAVSPLCGFFRLTFGSPYAMVQA